MYQAPTLPVRSSAGRLTAHALKLAGLAFLLTAAPHTRSLAQNGSMSQARNGAALSPISPVEWVNGNAGTSNSHYLESMSVIYRYVITGLAPGTHTLVVEYDIKKSYSHAIDYLTHYNRLEPHAQFSHPPEVINPLVDQPGVNPTPITYPIPTPVTNKTVTCTGLLQPATSFNALPANERLMTMFGGSAITDIQYLNVPDLNKSDESQQLQITFTNINSTVVFAWGGHIAAAADWCPGYSAAGISGSGYHMSLKSLDGSGGNSDLSLSASAVIPVPPCAIIGGDKTCPGQILSYSIDPYTGYTYTWSISNNSSGASIVGSNVGTSVTVNSGNASGGFTINVDMTTVGYSGVCSKEIQVSQVGLSETHTSFACSNNPGSVDLTATGGFPPYTYQWSNGQTVQDPAALAAGTYTVTVTDQSGCTKTLNVTIPALPALTAATTPAAVACFGGNNGAATASASGGTSPYSYAWSTGNTTASLNGMAAGSYTVTATDANGCSSTATAVITEPSAALASTVSAAQAVSCFGGANGILTQSVTGGTMPYSYQWSQGATTQNLTGVAAGTYTVTVTDANGCTTMQSASVSQPAAALSPTATASQAVSCFAGSDGQIDLTPAGGTPPYAYQWSNGSTVQDPSGLASGTYTVTVTDANGCTATASASVTQPAASLSASTTATTNISCFAGTNGTITLGVTGGTGPYAYLWSSGSTAQNPTGLTAGSYTVTVTDANGCTATQSAALTQPAGALSSVANTMQNASCFASNDGSINLTAAQGTPPYTYLWSNGTTTEDLTGLTAGAYTVTVTDANGCTASATATITQPAAALSASVSGSQNISCFAGNDGSLTLAVNGGTAPYAYLWSNGSTTQNPTTLPSGSYAVTVTDANGCTNSASASLTQPAAALGASASSTVNVSCYGGSNGNITMTVTGGTAPYAYLWNTGSTSQNLSNLPTGSYTVTATDANGCTAMQTIMVSQPAGPLTSVVNNAVHISCYGGDDGSIDLTITQGTPPYSFQWSNGANTEDLTTLTAGTYTVTVTDANGCTAQQTITLTQPEPALFGSATVTSNISCFSGNNGAIDLSVIGGTVPYVYQWSNGSTVQDPSGLAAGTYTVTITDANSCTANAMATISQPPGSLTAGLAVTQNVSCFGGSNGSINLNVSSGTPPYAFQWSNGAVTEDLSNLTAGTYTVTVTDANGCFLSQSAVIAQPAGALTAGITSTQNVNCFAGTNGSININVSQGTPPYSFQWSNGAATEDLTNLAAGTYTVTITDNHGCTETLSTTIAQPAGALTATLTAAQPVGCYGNTTGSIDLTVIQGTPPYAFSWSNGATTEDIGGLAAGSYTVTVTDANGCTETLTVPITQPAGALAATLSTTQNVSCFGGANGTINLTASMGTPPYTYQWSNGATSEDLDSLTAGTYAVTVTDANGCTTSQTASVAQPGGALAVTASLTQAVNCHAGNDGSVGLAVSAGTPPYAFAWSNGATTQNLTGLIAGTYSVTVTDANGCVENTTVTVTEPAGALVASLTASQDVSCFGGNDGNIDLTVSMGTPPYSFQWSNGAATEDLTGLPAGTYSVIVTDANGCTESLTAVITEPSGALALAASITSPVSCFSGNDGQIDLTVTMGTPPYSYQWSNGSVTEDLSALAAGTYTVIVTDANGCTDSLSATITQPAGALALTAAPVQAVSCFGGTNGAIDLTVSQGTAPYTFSWSNGATTEDITNLPAGTYSVVVTDANGCTAIQTVTITQPAGALQLTLAVTQSVSCNAGTNGAVTGTVTMGTPPYTYQWSNGDTTSGLTGVAAGMYTVLVTDANGCTITDSVTVGQPAGALQAGIQVTQAVSCFGGSNGSINLTPGMGTPPYTYAWSNGATTEDLSGLSAGTYTVTITDANGCTATASASVTQPAASLAVTGTTTTSNCLQGAGGTVAISPAGGTAPYAYAWSNGSTMQNLVNVPMGSYTVIITDINGCTTQGSYTVSDVSVFQASAAGPTDICVGELVSLVADSIPGASYQWYMNGQTLGGAVFNTFVTPASGSYYVTINHPCGTYQSDTMTVTVHTIDNVSLSPNVIICPGESTQLNATGGTHYAWTPATGLDYTTISNPIASPAQTTTYTVEITNEYGCKATGEILVTVLCDSLIIPSGYSPNDDGYNDAFVIKGIENYPKNLIWIYNRWGNLVYKTRNYQNTWNGTSNVQGIYIGKRVPNGTYYYVLDLGDGTEPRTGYIVLRH